MTRDAFWNVYRPGAVEHFIVHHFRRHPDFLPELSLVLEKEGELIGHILYVRGSIQQDTGVALPVLTCGPLSIRPGQQKRGYGTYLLMESLQKAADLGMGAVLLEGNPAFYEHCGFTRAKGSGLRYAGAPAGENPYFLYRELAAGYLRGVRGTYRPSEGYFIEEREAEAFDQTFPYKEKLKLPGQLFSE